MSGKWKDRIIDVSKLVLDLENPRLPKYVKDLADADQVRNYLLEHEGVMRIATSIVKNGYHKSAVAIVYEDSGEFVVLDGNRRLAACQLLLKPALAPNARDRRKFELLSKGFDKKQLKAVKIVVAPSRKAAEKEIWDIHVNQLLKPWEVLQKLRMYRNLIESGDYDIKTASSEYGFSQAKFKQELVKLFFYEEILENITASAEEEELLNSGFNKIDRVLGSANGKKMLNYAVDMAGNIIPKEPQEFTRKLKQVIPYIVTPGRVGAQVTQDELVTNLYSVIDPINFPIKKPPPGSGKPPTKPKPKKTKKVAPGSLAMSDWITYAEYMKYSGAPRVKDMLKEMKELAPKSHENVLLVSLRVLLELALYQKLEQRGYIKRMVADYKASMKKLNAKRVKAKKPIIIVKPDWSPTFREMLTYSLKAANGVILDPLARAALQKVVKGETDFVDDLNTFIHNVHYTPTKGDSERTWKKFGRLLFDIIAKIK